jgi:hypothetical protein
MQSSIITKKISIYVLVGIVVLAFFALGAEMLPEFESKFLVVPTLVLIIGWSLFTLIASKAKNENR